MSALAWCRRLAAWLVVGTCLAALAVGLLIPRLAGATPYTVLTGSMTPNLPPGTMVVIRPADTGDISTGDVITYQLKSGQPEVVTHRVVQVRSDLTGRVEWQTKGDANNVPDAVWVRQEQVRGELWYAVPWLGHVTRWLTSAQREQLIQIVAGLLLAYATFTFARPMLIGNQRRRPARAQDPEPESIPEEVAA